MSYLTFVVKGPEQAARVQLFLRLIVAETIGHTKTETIFKADQSYFGQIAAWFCEVPELIRGYGYPDGTCLIYSTHEDEVQS